jgi:ATP-dependent DNA helicase RecG
VTPQTTLTKALGATNARQFDSKLGLVTVGDLLRHYPRRYAQRGELTPLRDLRVGDHVTISARVKRAGYRRVGNDRYLTEILVTDGTGDIVLAFFAKKEHTAKWQVSRVREGAEGLFAGTVNLFNNKLQLLHPEVFEEADGSLVAGALVPVYPAAASLPTWNVQKAVQMVLDTVELGADPLPAAVREAHQLVGLREALLRVHRPSTFADVETARQRLKWDEAFVLQVTLAQRRAQLQAQGGTTRQGRPGGLLEAFDAVLPFTLTAGQAQVGEVLERELSEPHPMHRLLQGEVGSGKTLVALRAMLRVVDSGGQAALLAPTEVLAQQHARSLRAMLGPLATAGELGSPDVATRVALLTGSLTAVGRRAALAQAAAGDAGVVVGTHALLSEGVDFHDLGLVVVDEQHRFGVEQREALRAKGTAPHVLVMTATPIPRTVAMTVYGDLEVSTLTELPAGRSPIQTHVVPAGGKAFDRVWERIREEVALGRQAFVVCPRIGGVDAGVDAGLDQGEDGEPATEEGRRPAAAVAEVAPALAGGPLAGLRVEALHGRMPPEAKEEVMGRFAAGQVDVLVATTVIEVGVDVPNATVMVVLDPDRFGISQLHQLRGRVGRGGHAGLCLLVTEVDALSPAGERLRAVASTTDGFVLSRVDLEQRREGDVLGAAQSGSRSSLRMLQLLRDEDLILEARREALALVQDDPHLERHPALQAAVGQILDAERAEYLEKA